MELVASQMFGDFLKELDDIKKFAVSKGNRNQKSKN